MEEWTFSENEKEILELLGQFQIELEEKMDAPMKQIEYIKYYENFQISNINFKNVFTTEITEEDGKKSFHIYVGDSSKEIITIDKDGNIIIDEKLKPFLKDIDIDRVIDENELSEKSNLKGISEKTKPQDIEELNSKSNKREEDKDEMVNEDLKKQFKQDLQISYYRKIEDNQLVQQFPSLKGNKEIGMAYSKALNSYICVTNNGNGFEKAEEIEPSKLTMKSVISIDENGEKVERKVPHALMKTKDSRKEISITIGQYGYIETGIVDRLPCNERIEHQVREQGEGDNGRSNKEIRDTFNKAGREEIHEMAHEFKENEETGEEEQNIENINNDDILQLEDGTTTTFEKEAEKAKMSVEGFRELYEAAEGETIDEKLEEAHEQANRDYGQPSQEHNF